MPSCHWGTAWQGGLHSHPDRLCLGWVLCRYTKHNPGLGHEEGLLQQLRPHVVSMPIARVQTNRYLNVQPFVPSRQKKMFSATNPRVNTKKLTEFQ